MTGPTPVAPQGHLAQPPPAGPDEVATAGRTGPSLTVPALGLVGAAVALLAGGWQMLSPFALGTQPPEGDWIPATRTEFFTGLGLAILAALALVVFASDAVRRLRVHGAVRPRRSRRPAPVAAATPSPAPANAPGDDLAALLRPLVEALQRDNAARAPDATGSAAPPSSPAPSSPPSSSPNNAAPTALADPIREERP